MLGFRIPHVHGGKDGSEGHASEEDLQEVLVGLLVRGASLAAGIPEMDGNLFLHYTVSAVFHSERAYNLHAP